MRILQITDDLPPAVLGGSGRIAWETAIGLRSAGHDVHILTAAEDGVFPATEDGIAIHTIPLRGKRFAHFRSVFDRTRENEVLAVIKQVNPQIIHAHGLAWQMGYRWIAPSTTLGIPCVYTAHGVMTAAYGKVLEHHPHLSHDLKTMRWEFNPLRNFMIRSALNRCASVICVSDALRIFLAGTGLLHLVTLHNGIDLATWKESASRDEARKRLNLPTDKCCFLFAGRIGHDKGSTALDLSLPDKSLLLVAGDARDGMFHRINDRARVFPHQSPEQMRLLYSACDAAIVPSVYLDPFPTVCLEAMACSRPVIATCFGGAREAVQDGVTGWLVNPQDTQALGDRLQWCMDHPDEVRAAGRNAREHMERHFGIDRYIERLLSIYAEATGSAKGSKKGMRQ
ncbi:MAG: glycosyltransferase family 4 protein [Candidatus Peribacteraceae bacterium]|nr:glycosyltransferase family 4 protein [Candidatus Peribacteraceae bacterium]